jgi:hypothetical protein
MDENFTRHADFPIPGNGVILSRFKSTQNPRQNPQIPHGFHTREPFRALHSASPDQPNNAQIQMQSYISDSSANYLAVPEHAGNQVSGNA